MKKLFSILVALPLLGIGVANAQTGTTSVHVKLVDVLSLAVNNTDVNINFNTVTDYQNGVTVPLSGHLLVTSNKAYTLNVKASGSFAGTGVNTDVLDPSVVKISLPVGGNNTDLGVTPATISNLSSTDAALLTSANPAVSKLLDVTYAVPSSVSSTTAILGKKADTYTSTVTYTITQ